MKEIRTQDAVGHILCHDITQIIKDQKKGVLFKKGHIVREEDIPALLSVGKEHLFVWEKKEGILHENEAAETLYKISAGEHMHGSDIKEGKIELIADCDGVLKIRRDALLKVNSLGEMMIASRHGDFPIRKGDKIAGTRIIPLVIEKKKGISLKVTTDYTGIGKIQYIAGERQIPILDSEYTDKVILKLLVPDAETEAVQKAITEGTNGRAGMEKEKELYFAKVNGEVLTFED